MFDNVTPNWTMLDHAAILFHYLSKSCSQSLIVFIPFTFICLLQKGELLHGALFSVWPMLLEVNVSSHCNNLFTHTSYIICWIQYIRILKSHNRNRRVCSLSMKNVMISMIVWPHITCMMKQSTIQYGIQNIKV